MTDVRALFVAGAGRLRTTAARIVVVVSIGLATALMSTSMSSASVPNRARLASARDAPVALCPTRFGFPPGKISVPTKIAVRGSPRSTAGMVAYTNTEEYLIGPAHMACAGEAGEDGNGEIFIWPRGKRKPGQHSHEAGLTLTFSPACAICRAELACPFFRSFAARLRFPCSTGVPAGEVVTRLAAHAVLFEDPPRVAGDGWPSGGRYSADGIVGINGGQYGEVYRSTCTLPARENRICVVSLDDVRNRYG